MAYQALNRKSDDETGRAAALLDRFPSKLYRYAGVSAERIQWIGELITSSKIYLPSPPELNDPMECRIPFNFSASKLKIETYWAKWASLHGIKGSNRRKTIAELVLRSKTRDGQKKLSQIQFDELSRYGILSLTTEPNNMQMWSYYAEGHSGVVLEFSTIAETLIGFGLGFIPIEVAYSRQFPECSYYRDSLDSQIQTILGTKAVAWEHEREWRLVRANKAGKNHIPPSLLTGVTFGLRTSAETEKLIKSWAASRSHPLNFYRIKSKPDSFDLVVVLA